MYTGKLSEKQRFDRIADLLEQKPLGKHEFVVGSLGMCQKCALDREGHRKKFA